MEALQEKLNYSFQNPELLRTALTHSSYANEQRCESNERLEFVGDSVLGMVAATHLFQHFPALPEGRLTRMRASLVCEDSLWETAKQLRLGDYLRLGKGEETNGGRTRPSILADCVEAIIAAMYLDGGLAPASAFIHSRILSRLVASPEGNTGDFKTLLQELVQRNPGASVSYRTVGASGPDHDKRFFVEALVGNTLVGKGEGRTKKEAEQQAARDGLRRLQP